MTVTPNVNVVEFNGETWALAEGGLPALLSENISSTRRKNLHSGFSQGMCAHPKVDAVSGEMMLFRADWAPPYLRYGVLSQQGQPMVDLPIELNAPVMMHDMAITATYSVFFDTNVAYDFDMLNRGFALPLRWMPERCARIGICPRLASSSDSIRWFDIENCFIQHVANAYDGGSKIVLDVIRYSEFLVPRDNEPGFIANPLGYLWRYELDLNSGLVSECALLDRAMELPRINEFLTGRQNRYVYAVLQPSDEEMRGLIKVDLQSGAHQIHHIAPGDQNSEAVFVPRAKGDIPRKFEETNKSTNEDDGWLLVCVYRAATHTSDIIVLDARNISSEPLATVKLPCRIPAGFHGTFVPG